MVCPIQAIRVRIVRVAPQIRFILIPSCWRSREENRIEVNDRPDDIGKTYQRSKGENNQPIQINLWFFKPQTGLKWVITLAQTSQKLTKASR